MKILLLDDDEFIRKVYRDALKQSGYEVFEAKRVKDMQEWFEKHQVFDVICTDNVLPDGSAVSVIQWLKESQYAGKMVVLSALGQDEDIAAAQRAGADRYFIKGKVLPRQFVKELGELLSKK